MGGRCLCASGYSTGVGEIEDKFGVSSEIGTLGLSLYLVRILPTSHTGVHADMTWDPPYSLDSQLVGFRRYSPLIRPANLS